MRLQARRRFTVGFCGGKLCKKVLEDALGAPASSYEALLLSAGKCWRSPSKRPYWEKSWICQYALGLVSAPKLSGLPVQKQTPCCSLLLDVAVGRGPTSKVAGVGAVWAQVSSPSVPLASQPSLPHAGASFLHTALFHLPLLSSQPVMQFLLSQQPSRRRAEHLPHRTGKEPTCRATARPPRVTSQHVDAQRRLSKDPRHFLAAWGFFRSLLHATKLLFALQTSGRL